MVDRALIISGAAGVGKSSVAAAVGRALSDVGRSVAVVDVDTLAQFGPAPWRRRDGLSFYDELKCKNVGAVWANFRDAGACHLVVAATIDSHRLRGQYVNALEECAVHVALLVAPRRLLIDRLVGRKDDLFHPRAHAPDGAVRQEALAGVHADQERLQAAAVEDFTVANDTSVGEAASAVMRWAGWV
jgi:hypothetical protein